MENFMKELTLKVVGLDTDLGDFRRNKTQDSVEEKEDSKSVKDLDSKVVEAESVSQDIKDVGDKPKSEDIEYEEYNYACKKKKFIAKAHHQ